MKERARLPAALAVFVAWVLITGFAGALFSKGETASLDQVLSTGVAPQIALACVFLAIAAPFFPRREMGLVASVSRRSLLLTLPVGVYLALFFGLAVLLGLPPLGAIGFALINVTLVGISEEIACRGILYLGLRSRLRVWPAVWLTSLIFGAMHVLNGFVTGQFVIAAIQALAAICTGMMLMAIRIRTGSLYPAIVLHILWNAGALLAVMAATQQSGGQAVTPEMGLILLLPVVGVLPNLLYGLWLLRHASRDEARPPEPAGI
ncbi:MAG: lysostaphin resistance A-like protein [Sphingomonadales bacterium]